MTSSNGDRSVFNSDWDQYIDGWAGVTGQAPAVLSVYLQAHSSGFTSVAQSVSLENSVTIHPVTDTAPRTGLDSHRGLREASTVDRSPLTTGNVVHDLSVGGNVPMGQLPTCPDNVAWRIVERIAEAYRSVMSPSLALPRVDVKITKRIPLSAGLGSKAADVAAAIVAADRFFGYHFIVRAMGFSAPGGTETSSVGSLSSNVIRRIAREECPDEYTAIELALEGGTSLINLDHNAQPRSDVTTQRTPLLAQGPLWWVITMPVVTSPEMAMPWAAPSPPREEQAAQPHHNPSAQHSDDEDEDVDESGAGLCHRVVERLAVQRAEMASGKRSQYRVGNIEDIERALVSCDPTDVAKTMGNELYPAATSVVPSLRRVIQAGTRAGALGTIVAQQGPACAMLCVDEDHARDVQAELAGSGVVRTARIAPSHRPGNQSGAHLVSDEDKKSP